MIHLFFDNDLPRNLQKILHFALVDVGKFVCEGAVILVVERFLPKVFEKSHISLFAGHFCDP